MAQIPWLPQFFVGEGVDSTTGRIFGQALDFTAVMTAATGQRTELVLDSVANSRELSEKLDIAASASLNLGLFSASAEFKLATAASINSYYTYALVRATVQNPPQLLREPQFRPHAATLLSQRGWEAFAGAYGWEYVQGVITGGTYYGLIEIQTTDESQQREVKAKLSVAYGPFKADASFATTLQEATRTAITRVVVQQTGGSGDLIETDLEGMVQQARTFSQLVKDNPATIAALVADYRSTVPVPDGVPPPDSLIQVRQKNVLDDLGRSYLAVRDYKQTLEFVLRQQRLSEFDDFRDASSDAIERARNQYQDALNLAAVEMDAIVAQARQCAENASQCKTYVSTFRQVPLPRKGGELMNLKQLEDKLTALESQVSTTRSSLDQRLNDLTANRHRFAGIELSPGATIATSSGRMHISGTELLYLLNQAGVVIGREWGGTGNLAVEGRITGQLERLDVASTDVSAWIRAHDLVFGHPSRHGEPGRALVDEGRMLTINFGRDWPDGVRYEGRLEQKSTRAIKDDVQALSTESALEIVKGLEPVTYRFKGDAAESEQLGFIAEDVPDAIASHDRKAINVNHIVAVLTAVVKHQGDVIRRLTEGRADESSGIEMAQHE